jgi:hypothetical protein
MIKNLFEIGNRFKGNLAGKNFDLVCPRWGPFVDKEKVPIRLSYMWRF